MEDVEELSRATIANGRLERLSDGRSEIAGKSFEITSILNEAYFFKFWSRQSGDK